MHFCIDGVGARNPMNRPFYLAIAVHTTAASLGVVSTAQLHNLPGTVLDHLITTNDVTKPKTDFTAGFQAKELAWCLLHEIVLLNP